MKYFFKYILLIISFLCFGEMYAQSLITAKFYQNDTICEGSSGLIRLYMYNSNKDQSVSNLKLTFKYDPAYLQLKRVIPLTVFADSQMEIAYPEPGICTIVDTLRMDNNFYYENPDEIRSVAFDLEFEGNATGTTHIEFVDTACYFKTLEDELILSFYNNSPDIRIQPGYIKIVMEQTGIGCSYETKGRVIADVIEGVEKFEYKWSRGKTFANLPNEAGELEGGELILTVKDGNGCLYDTTMIVEVLPAPEISWEYAPDPAVIEYPIDFYATDVMDASNWFWTFVSPDKDTIDLGEHARKQEFSWVFWKDGDYEISLTATGMNGCDTTVTETVSILPPQLEFKNLVTPNGNRFRILLQQAIETPLTDIFISHQVLIYDRTGRKVYETDNFTHDGWDGKGCPNGSYFFVLKGRSARKEYVYKGSLVILGG
ncbi:MAG: gliding motility-associated C-terminal domain-containing protein [Bacteroidales bacterium]|nr:gliding motility-associated C-terminal domain-containing protein [Bacteroidales bacterium]